MVYEVYLRGKYGTTNVITSPYLTTITPISID